MFLACDNKKLIIDKHCFQALAKTMLEKQWTSQPIAHKEGETQKNTHGIDELKVTVG